MTLATSSGNELLELLTRYNEDLWPAHLATYSLVVAAVGLLFVRRGHLADRTIAGVLAALWLWLGVVFQAMYATDVDLVLGVVYTCLFVVQAYLLTRVAVRGHVAFCIRNGRSGVLGWTMLAYATAIYPVLGLLLGHGWPEAPLLGMAPCPTVIATFGFLLLARPPIPVRLLVVPFIWALLAPPAAMGRGVYEDAGLLLAGVLTVVVISIRDHWRRPRARRDPDVPQAHAPDAPGRPHPVTPFLA